MNKRSWIITVLVFSIIGLVLISKPVVAEETHNIALKSGYNLITLPVIPQNTNIESVLSSITSKVQDVWELNPSDTDDPWKRYRPGLEDYSDLTQMTAGNGYWIKVSSNTTLQVTGEPISANTLIYLRQGWNIIGWPYQNSEEIATALSGLTFGTDYNQISRFNSATGAQENFLNQSESDDFSSFEPNKAYYIFMLQDQTIIRGASGYSVDTTPPIGTIVINNGDPYTVATAVILYLAAEDNVGGSGISQMKFSNNNIDWSYAQTYASSCQWAISTNAGQHTVYAKFSDFLGNWSSAVSDSIVLDTSSPSTVTVTDDGENTVDASQLHAAWTQSSDFGSGIKEYKYAIGTSAGATDIVNWTTVGLNTEITHTGLSLVHGTTYYISVYAIDNAGNESSVASSDGIAYGAPPEITDITISSANNRYHQGSPITIQATATDADGDTIEYKYYADNNVIQDWTTSSQIAWTPDLNYFAENTIRIEVKTQTEAGNYLEEQIYIFRRAVSVE